MKRPSLFRRFLDKFRGAKPSASASASAAPAAPSKDKPPRRKTDSSFEPLEGRIAPAVLLNASTVQFTDTDGDLVTVQFSKALFKEGSVGLNNTLDSVFKFLDTGTVRTAAEGGLATDVHELATLDLAVLASIGLSNPANGTSISITAVSQSGVGDDQANVGYIKAAHSPLFGIALNKVVVDGDLGRIDAGDRTKPLGIKSITVGSWGTLGTATQLATASLDSNVTSGIGSMTVLGDFQDAALRVVHGDSSARNEGKIGKLTIGGDILASTGNNLANAGAIATSGDIGNVKVGDVLGGGGQNSGKISANGTIGAVTLNGDLRGGTGKDSGQIIGTGGIGKISLHTLWAGSGEGSGRIASEGNIAGVDLQEIAGHHSIIGGAAGKNAATISAGDKLGSLTVEGNISGGAGETSGRVAAGTILAKAVVGGHLIGGAGSSSGQILAGVSIGSLSIDGAAQEYASIEAIAGAVGVPEKQILSLGDVLGRPSEFTLSYVVPGTADQTTISLSSTSTAEEIAAALNALPAIGTDGVTVALQNGNIEITFTAEGQQAGLFSADVTQASIVGGAGVTAGSVLSNGSIGKVSVQNLSGGAALKAGDGVDSGSISATTNLGKVVLLGDVDGSGAAGTTTGAGRINAGGNLASFTITGNLIGGAGTTTGSVIAEGSIGTIKITGSLLGGSGESSGSILAGGKVTSAFVTGSLDGGSGENSAALVAGMDITGPADFGKVTVLGQLLGDGVDSASIRAGGKLGTVVVGTLGTVLSGGTGSGSASIIGRTGINSVTVNGHVVGGDGINSAIIQSSAKIATVKIAGNLDGGAGDGSGSIAATDLDDVFPLIPGNLGKVTVLGDVLGDAGIGSGQIRAEGSIQSVKVGALSGGDGDWSGSIVAGSGDAAFLDEFRSIGGIAKVVIDGPISGGIGSGSGNIQAGAKIGNLTVNGAVSETTLRTGRDFGSILINGNVSDVLISAESNARATSRADVAIAKLTVNGNVADSVIRAGYDLFDNAVNGNAQIGAVKVSGTWTASSIAAGVMDVEGDGFGDEDDVVIAGGTISRIASIVIGQTVTGTIAPGDHFGFVAQTIGSVKIAGASQPLNSAKNTIPLAGTPVTDDTSIREVP